MITMDIATFRALFPEFADVVEYPDAALQTRWDAEAVAYVSDEDCGDLAGTKRAYAIQIMLAHLLRLSKLAAAAGAGATPAGVVTSATIDKVSVTLAPPPARDARGYWLAQTPYGQQLSAYLTAQAVGGFYVGGRAERAGFRKVGGAF